MSDVREVAIGFWAAATYGGVAAADTKDRGRNREVRGVRLNALKDTVRDASKARDTVPMDLLTANPDDVIDNPDIQIVAGVWRAARNRRALT